VAVSGLLDRFLGTLFFVFLARGCAHLGPDGGSGPRFVPAIS